MTTQTHAGRLPGPLEGACASRQPWGQIVISFGVNLLLCKLYIIGLDPEEAPKSVSWIENAKHIRELSMSKVQKLPKIPCHERAFEYLLLLLGLLTAKKSSTNRMKRQVCSCSHNNKQKRGIHITREILKQAELSKENEELNQSPSPGPEACPTPTPFSTWARFQL